MPERSGQQIPAGLTALDTEGQAVKLAGLADERPVILCLLRHYG